MVAGALAHLNWRLRGLLRGQHWTLAAALGLTAFAVGFYFSSVAPTVARAAQLRSHADLLRAAQGGRPDATAPQDARSQLAAFYGALASREHVPDLLQRLHKLADGQELLVDQADYRPVHETDGRLVRYQLTLPVIGTYPEIRRFLGQAGKELPGLSLDGVVFQREQIGDDFVGAQLKLTLFVDTARGPARGAR